MYFHTYMILETPHLRSLQVFCLINVITSTCTPFTWKCQTRNPLCTTPTYPPSLGEVREGRICESRWDPSRTNTSDVVRWHQCGWTKSFGLWPLYQHQRRSNEGSYSRYQHLSALSGSPNSVGCESKLLKKRNKTSKRRTIQRQKTTLATLATQTHLAWSA